MKKITQKGTLNMTLSFEDNPNEILDELLKHHDIATLRSYLNKTVRKKEPKINTYVNVAVDVYLIQYANQSSLSWAKTKLHEERGVAENTSKNHITKFRKMIKNKIDTLGKESGYDSTLDESINKFIKDYVEYIHEVQHEYMEGEMYGGRIQDYEEMLQSFISNIEMEIYRAKEAEARNKQIAADSKDIPF